MSNIFAPRRPQLRRSVALVATAVVVASVAAGAAAPAQAASASLTSSPSTATAGGAVLLTAQGFTPGDDLLFDLDGTDLLTSPLTGSSESADANGAYSGDAFLPDDVTVGSHTVSVTDASGSGVASTTITIVPQPTATVTPSSLTLSQYLANGVTATFSGFAPGVTVLFGVSDAASGEQLSATAVAGANGEVSLTYVPQAGSAYARVGAFDLVAVSADLSIVAESASFEVTADAATPGIAPVIPPANAPVASPVKRPATFTG